MRILTPKGCRSDDFILPLIKKLEKDDFFQVYKINLVPANFIDSYNIIDHACKSIKPDMVLITGDRIEMFAASNAAFLNNVKIAHLGAGITNSIATYDDILRHNITLQADIALCEDNNSAFNVSYLWSTIGKYDIVIEFPGEIEYLKTKNIYIVGNPYLEGLENLDAKFGSPEPYDLILYNAETKGEDIINKNIQQLEAIWESINKLTYWIGGNPDKHFSFKPIQYKEHKIIYHDNLPRSQFLALLKNATRYITNSSNAYYEAMPLGLKRKQIILIGERNKNRSTPMEWKQEYKSSDKIIEILKEYYNKNIKKEE